MRKSITEAAHAARAMDRVATGIATSVENTARMAGDQRDFWSRQMRAYIFVQTASILNVADPPTPTPPGQQLPNGAITLPDRGPIILITIRNSGHTPANNVIHYMNAIFREFPLTSPLPERPEIDPRLRSIFSIPPGGTTSKNYVFPNRATDHEIAELRAGTGAIFIYGEISYNDIFGVERITRYRFRHNSFSGIVGITSEVTGTKQGNNST